MKSGYFLPARMVGSENDTAETQGYVVSSLACQEGSKACQADWRGYLTCLNNAEVGMAPSTVTM
jgi:hypothetical protein